MRGRSRSPEVADLLRAASGGLLFGVPLVYTMEVWQLGAALPPSGALALIAAMVLLATILDRSAGFRFVPDRRWSSSFVDGIEVVAASLLGAGLLLVVIGEVTESTSIRTATLQTIALALPFTIGGSIANEFLAAEGDEDSADRSVATETGGAVLGALVVGLSIAPTDEVTTIAGQAGPPLVLAILVTSLVVSHGLVFTSGLRRSSFRTAHVVHDLGRTAVAYGAAAAVSVVMLAIYGRLGDGGELREVWAHVVVLAFPASIGAAVGRLAA